jgi:hypothetical protein
MRYGVDDIGNFIEFKKNGELVKEYSGETVRQLKKNILDHSPENISSAVANYIIYELYDMADGINSLPSDSTMFFLKLSYDIAPNWILPSYDLVYFYKKLNNDSLANLILNNFIKTLHPSAESYNSIALLYDGLDSDKTILFAQKAICAEDDDFSKQLWYSKFVALFSKKGNLDSVLHYLSLAFSYDSTDYFAQWHEIFPSKFLFECQQEEKIIHHLLNDYSKTDRIMLLAFSSLLSQSKTISQKVKNNLNQLISSLSPSLLLDYYWWLSKFYLDISNLDQSEHFIQKAYLLNNQDFWTLVSYRDLCLRTKNFTMAQTLNENLISLDSSNVRHYIIRCEILINMNKDTENIFLELEKTTQMVGNRASFLFRIGNLYLQSGGVSIGNEILKKARLLGFDPNNDDYEAEEISSAVSELYFTCP